MIPDDDTLHYTGRYLNALRRHPDCSDPDHPGCPACDLDQEDYSDDLDDFA